ncbi:MAG: nucleoside-diphosphate kinase [Candidatus Pacebacteria bacterium]|nr:nucleoside-diphosphate kinase [Candidatus Paceibacterota bacterium]
MNDFTIALIKLLPYSMPRLVKIEEIITHIFKNDFRIREMRWVVLKKREAENLYDNGPDWLHTVGNKIIKNCQEAGVRPEELLKTNNPLELGQLVTKWNVEYLTKRPLPVMEIIGSNGNVVQEFRDFLGPTDPSKAPKHTLRGHHAINGETGAKATLEQRVIYNTAHASDSPEAAVREKKILWAAQIWSPYNE